MLKDNIKSLRKQKGLSQEELSVKLNVVRQTISKWEQGLSVPDAQMLISIAEVFDVSVSELLGEKIPEKESDDLKKIAEKLEVVNFQLAKRRENRRKFWHWFFITLCIVLIIVVLIIGAMGNTYMDWIGKDPESTVVGVGTHAFVWMFMRVAPIIFLGSIIGVCLTRKRQ